MGRYALSERDYQRVQTMLRWYEREKNLRDKFRRRNSNVGSGDRNVRRAKVQDGGVPSNNTGPFTCKLLDKDGNEIGSTIDVYPVLHLGSNNFDGDVWPDLAAVDPIPVFKDVDGKWYFPFVFDDTTICT